MPPNAAILFEPDAYLLSEPKLMGRQAAGNSFLRAAVAGRCGQTLYAYSPYQRSGEVFKQMVQALDATANAQWISADKLDGLAQLGTLYLPGPGLDEAARLRLRVGCAAYSLVGVTHTTASHRAMDAIVNLLSAPVMPWDALICTSTAVLETVKLLLNAQIEHLRWRFGQALPVTLPQLPVIPLGVHCADFDFSAEQKKSARLALGIADDEILLVFVGRLSFHAKAHPHAMYLAAQTVAEKTGKKIALLQCGWFGNDAIKASFVEGAKRYCPSVRALFVDGRDPVLSKQSWASADVFISLSDNIQETFGITPIEAMASGIPVVVTDWDGYKDTVRDGVDGFRIPTWMPPPHLGEKLALMHEAGTVNYDIYCGLNCQLVSVSMPALIEKLTCLVQDYALRQSMGNSGKAHAKARFDWSVIYNQYQQLYTQLASIRQSALQDKQWQEKLASAPKIAAGRLDPFYSFRHYPTHLFQPQTLVTLQHTNAPQRYAQLSQDPLFNYAQQVLPSQAVVEKITQAFNEQAVLSLSALSNHVGLGLGEMVLAAAVLVKMDLLRLVDLNAR